MSINDDSIKTLWQTLPSEKLIFNEAQLRARARQFQTKIKRRNIIEYASYVVLFGLIIYVMTGIETPVWQDWMFSGLTVIGAVIAIWGYYRLAGAKTVPEHSSSNLLEFMRSELVRQRDYAATGWRWAFLPFLPAVIFLLIDRWLGADPNLIKLTDKRYALLVLAAFMIALTCALLFWQWLKAAKYQRQLDDLERYTGHD